MKLLFILWAIFPDGDRYQLTHPKTLGECLNSMHMEKQALVEVLAVQPDLPVPEIKCEAVKQDA